MKDMQSETNKEPQEVKQHVSKKRMITVTSGVWFAAAGIAVFIAVICFVGGMQVGKSTVAKTSTERVFGDTSGQFGSGSAPTRGRGMMGLSGTVTAVSATSISLTSAREGGTTTYTITSSTTVTNGTATAAVGDLKVGDTVRVQASTTTTTDAATIELNPTTPTAGGGMMQPY